MNHMTAASAWTSETISVSAAGYYDSQYIDSQKMPLQSLLAAECWGLSLLEGISFL